MTNTTNLGTIQMMLEKIEDYLPPSLVSSLDSTSRGSDIYEGYLFTLICIAAEIEGARVTLRSFDSSNPTEFVFRTSPGYISSRNKDYGYAILRFPGKPELEAHLDVRVSGTSNVLHECDICVLLKEEADLCRYSKVKVAPRASRVIISAEAKFYTSSLGLELGREFLGHTMDVRSDKSFFVTNCTSTSIAKLLSSKKRFWDHNIQPQNTKNVERLRNLFQTAFKDFIARY